MDSMRFIILARLVELILTTLMVMFMIHADIVISRNNQCNKPIMF